MRQQDKEIVRQFDALRTESAHLTQKAKRSEPDEALADHQLAHFTKRALDLIINIRKQESAVTTWYQEAFQRDRGNVD